MERLRFVQAAMAALVLGACSSSTGGNGAGGSGQEGAGGGGGGGGGAVRMSGTISCSFAGDIETIDAATGHQTSSHSSSNGDLLDPDRDSNGNWVFLRSDYNCPTDYDVCLASPDFSDVHCIVKCVADADTPRFSPDGSHVAYYDLGDASHSDGIAVVDLQGNQTAHYDSVEYPSWTPDNRLVACGKGTPGVFISGKGTMALLYRGQNPSSGSEPVQGRREPRWVADRVLR